MLPLPELLVLLTAVTSVQPRKYLKNIQVENHGDLNIEN